MNLKEINGQYNPSFFNIILETNEDVSLAYKKYSSTFAHEFIHYLQDLILPYNIRYNFTNLSWFLRIRESVYEQKKLQCPFVDWDDNTRLTKLQFEYTFGLNLQETAFIDFVEQINSIESISSDRIEQQGRSFILYKYQMSVNNDSIIYNLGARDLLEYIAYKIESKHYNTEGVYQLPYESIDLLFDHYGLSQISTDIRLCIAQFCLYNDNPIRMLFLHFLENEEFKDNIGLLSYNKCYSILLNYEFVTTDNKKETLSDKFNRRINDFSTILTEQYSDFYEIGNWIIKIKRFVTDVLNNRFIFADMYRMSKAEFADFINLTINEIGLPLVMNNKEECISLQSEELDVSQFSQFYILQEFLNSVLYTDNQINCPIVNFCLANGGKPDNNCGFNPKVKISNNEDCQYIKFLKSFSMEDI